MEIKIDTNYGSSIALRFIAPSFTNANFLRQMENLFTSRDEKITVKWEMEDLFVVISPRKVKNKKGYCVRSRSAMDILRRFFVDFFMGKILIEDIRQRKVVGHLLRNNVDKVKAYKQAVRQADEFILSFKQEGFMRDYSIYGLESGNFVG